MAHPVARLSDRMFAGPRGEIAAHPGIRLVTRVLSVLAILLVSGFLFIQARHLWLEWRLLQAEVRTSKLLAPVGFLDIAPVSSYAQPPNDWIRDDGTHTLLWSRWEGGVGHRWYQFASGELDRAQISKPSRLFISRAIDFPLVETDGGTIWNRIPSESMVLGHRLEGRKCAYPLGVLRKVEVINDVIDGHPYLIDSNPFVPESDGYAIYDATLDGHRVTMTASGYFQESQPILVDRGTDSLWLDTEGPLVAIAGKLKGKQLVRVAHPAPVTWSSWLGENGQGRLVVGADRTQGIPQE